MQTQTQTQTQTPILYPVLSSRHPHERDVNILFDEPTHVYTITTDLDSKYTSVTTWNHTHFSHFDGETVIKNMMKGKNWNPQNKYWGLTPEQIKQQWSDSGSAASGAGTEMHLRIECFMNQELWDEDDKPLHYTHEDLLQIYNEEREKEREKKTSVNIVNNIVDEVEEWSQFLKYIQAFPHLKPYRTEWTVYDEDLKIAGSIDMVYENPDGSLAIYDWKRSKEITKVSAFKKTGLTQCVKHLPDTNFWHYSLQLNMYKAILETKYNKKVTDLYLVRLHPDNPKKTFDLIKCADLSKEVANLFKLRKTEIENK